MTLELLLEAAKEAREKAYAPYSNFKVGASVETKSGKMFTGCNIENSSYSLTCCAERVAIFKALSSGERDFRTLVVVGDVKGPISPCGACRQVMSEFFDDDVKIYLANLHGDITETTISELLPRSFSLDEQ